MLNLVEESKSIIAIDSSPFVGTGEICLYYAKLCERLGLDYELLNENTSILVNASVQEAEVLIYNTLETKDPGPHSFWDETNSNPYEASLNGENFFGLGVAGSKLNLLQQIVALKKIKETGCNPNVVLFGASYSEKSTDLKLVKEKGILSNNTAVLVSRPTSGRLLKGICGKAKVRFELPLGKREAELKSKHFHQEDTATQTRIFRGHTTHGASPAARTTTNAFKKLIDYVEMLPQGVLILNMEAGHSTDQVPSEAVLELNLSQPIDDSVANKLLDLVKKLEKWDESFQQIAKSSGALLPSLNIGKLRHSEESLFLDVSFFLPKEYSKEKLLISLNDIRTELKTYNLNFEIRKFLEPKNFNEDRKMNASICSSLESLGEELIYGESVIESVARNVNELGISCLQFGLGIGLGNIDEPNEYIKTSDIEKSMEFFKSLMEKY